jgi:tetratricopeptide (TPR) repeat protein
MRSALLPKNNAPDASAEATLNLGLEHLRRNHLAPAAEAFREGLRRSPDHPLTLSYYGLCLARLETNYAEALKLCKRAAHLDPYDPTLLVNLGKVYRLIGDRGAAYRSLRAAWSLDRRHHPTMQELARMGMRRRPVIPWLSRDNALNVLLGKLRARFLRATNSPPSQSPH